MNTLIYLLQVTGCWGAFALLYVVVLRRETFFGSNRCFLLLAVVTGLILPITGEWVVQHGPTGRLAPFVLPAITPEWKTMGRTIVGWDCLGYLIKVYWIGFAIVAFRLFWGIGQLIRMRLQGQSERLADGCRLIRSEKTLLPFSFFRWIFVPVGEEGQTDFDKMLAHERAHVHGWHTFDVLSLEIVCLFFWFHPLAHWYRRSLRTVHEYLADAAASKATDRRQYGLLLIRQAQGNVPIAIANHFFQSPLKQRLTMLTRQSSPLVHRWKYATALPLFLLLWACTQTALPEEELRPAKNSEAFELDALDQAPEYPGGIPALATFLSENIRYPEASRQARAEGYVVLTLELDERGVITAVQETKTSPNSALKSFNQRPDMVKEAIRVVKIMSPWAPGKKGGRAVRCKMTLPIRFKLE